MRAHCRLQPRFTWLTAPSFDSEPTAILICSIPGGRRCGSQAGPGSRLGRGRSRPRGGRPRRRRCGRRRVRAVRPLGVGALPCAQRPRRAARARGGRRGRGGGGGPRRARAPLLVQVPVQAAGRAGAPPPCRVHASAAAWVTVPAYTTARLRFYTPFSDFLALLAIGPAACCPPARPQA